MLTRKYYQLIADVIKGNTLVKSNKMLPQINKAGLVADLCKEFKRDNSNFNYNRFINACDVLED